MLNRPNSYATGPEGQEVARPASAQSGERGGLICFDAQALAERITTHEELIGIALHEHAHHFNEADETHTLAAAVTTALAAKNNPVPENLTLQQQIYREFPGATSYPVSVEFHLQRSYNLDAGVTGDPVGQAAFWLDVDRNNRYGDNEQVRLSRSAEGDDYVFRGTIQVGDVNGYRTFLLKYGSLKDRRYSMVLRVGKAAIYSISNGQTGHEGVNRLIGFTR